MVGRHRLSWCLVLLVALAGCNRGGEQGVASAQKPPAFGGGFTLTNQDNQKFSLGDINGRPAVLFFGYTSCPDMCPMTMSRIISALKLAGTGASEVATLFVSVDPRRDTPAALKEYVSAFSAPIVALTGTEEELRQVAADYHATYEVVGAESPNYLINHTSAIFIIDRHGKLREYFAYNEKPETLAAAIKAVLHDK